MFVSSCKIPYTALLLIGPMASPKLMHYIYRKVIEEKIDDKFNILAERERKQRQIRNRQL